MKKFLIVVLLVAFFTSSAWAQQDSTLRKKSGPRRQLATIVFAGLGGAILGLSTLSFYGRPQDQLSNIAIGFAVGVIAGTAYVTFRSATTRDYYEEKNKDPNNPGAFEEDPKLQWAPMISRNQINSATSLGGQMAIHF